MKLNRTFIILIFIVVAFTNTNAHPVHISLVNMDLTEDGKILFSVKLFTDDFESIINTKNNTKLSFTEGVKTSIIDKYVTNYISNNFIISTNSVDLSSEYRFKKIEMDKESIWFFFEIENKDYNFDKLVIKNSLMCDLYQDQTNLFIINIKGEEKAYRFNNKNQKKAF